MNNNISEENQSEIAARILAALEERAPVKREGKVWRTRCPNPGHEEPSK